MRSYLVSLLFSTHHLCECSSTSQQSVALREADEHVIHVTRECRADRVVGLCEPIRRISRSDRMAA